MTDVLAVVAYLVLPLIGVIVWRVPVVREETLAVRIAIATGAGALIVGLTMALMSLLGIQWSRTALFLPLALIAIAGVVLRPKQQERRLSPPHSGWWTAGTVFMWLVTLYGTLTARESCGDLHFTWGPKAIRFFRAGKIDAELLQTYPQLTTDYPPLQTLLFAWSNTFSHQFSWWSAVILSPLFLIATLVIIRTWSGDGAGTFLVAATLTWTFTLAYPAGCAEPLLLLFETIAIAALTFLKDPRAQTFYAALGCAGAAWTKLEGSTFTIAVVITILLVQRNWRRALIVAAPAALLVGAWLTFVLRSEILLMYGGAKLPIQWQALPVVLKTLAKVAKWELWWIPWIVPAVLIAIGNVRRALVPISISLLTAGATVSFYLRAADPVWWIESSSPRVILTPLLALLLGAIAAHQGQVIETQREPSHR
ncbi:MAG TPA: hypothetical protein VHK90_15375 [Thermoanaerobaculia bacterium]|nr:hypothetical protein [Thermoanaerobaculia bacterium]